MKRLMSLVLAGSLYAAGADSALLYWAVGADNTIPFAYAQVVQIPAGQTTVDKQPLAVVDAQGGSLGTSVWAEGFDPASATLGLTTLPVWSEIDPGSGGVFLIELYGLEGQVAWSQMATASDLEPFLKTDVTAQIMKPWSPQTVPEPSSTLLLLLGGAFLGLRRKCRS